MNKPWSIVAFCLVAVTLEAQPRAPGSDVITKQALKADLFFLASDNLQGRLTNTPGNRIAADWIAQRFERMGLTPGGPDGSYVQPFNLMVETLGPVDRNTLAITPIAAAGPQALTYGADFYPQRFSATTSAKGGLVFAGFGITSAALKYDDYAPSPQSGFGGASGAVRDKIALVIDHEPGERDPASPFDG